jgi:hypothetical protein
MEERTFNDILWRIVSSNEPVQELQPQLLTQQQQPTKAKII